MRPRVLLLLAVLLLVPATAHAGANLIVPVSGRQAGLVVTNLEPREVPLVLTYYGHDGNRAFATASLAGRGTLAIGDVPAGAAMIRVSSAMDGARVTAAYGALPAIPVDALPTEHVFATGGRRTVVGVANPWPVPATITLTLHGAGGQELGRLHRLVPAMDVLQLDEVAAASVAVTSQVGVYAYAADDAVFVPGTGVAVSSPAITPPCAEPASLGFAKQPAGGWIVVMKPETAVEYIQTVLPARHGYTVMSLYESLPGFAAELTPQQLAALRCDGAVELIEQIP